MSEIKGQAWIYTDENGKQSLVQDVIGMEEVNNTTDMIDGIKTLIPDIWSTSCLLSTSSAITSSGNTFSSDYPVYTNGKNYFFWTYEMTDSDNPDSNVIIILECPHPTADKFFNDATGELKDDPGYEDGSYAKYWYDKTKTAIENEKYYSAIQKKEIVFAKSQMMQPDGTLETISENRISNSDISDITNLLSLF